MKNDDYKVHRNRNPDATSSEHKSADDGYLKCYPNEEVEEHTDTGITEREHGSTLLLIENAQFRTLTEPQQLNTNGSKVLPQLPRIDTFAVISMEVGFIE